MKRNYLSLYSSTKPYIGLIATYDLKKQKWVHGPRDIIMDNDIAHDLAAYDFGECFFYLSSCKDISNMKFERNRDGEIRVSDRPRKLSIAEGVALATKVHNSSEAQLANLKPEALTNENRYIKKVSIFTDSVLEQAARHRANGMALRDIAQRLSVNYESLRKTLRTTGSSLQNRPLCH